MDDVAQLGAEPVAPRKIWPSITIPPPTPVPEREHHQVLAGVRDQLCLGQRGAVGVVVHEHRRAEAACRSSSRSGTPVERDVHAREHRAGGEVDLGRHADPHRLGRVADLGHRLPRCRPARPPRWRCRWGARPPRSPRRPHRADRDLGSSHVDAQTSLTRALCPASMAGCSAEHPIALAAALAVSGLTAAAAPPAGETRDERRARPRAAGAAQPAEPRLGCSTLVARPATPRRLVRGVRLPPRGRHFTTWDPQLRRSPAAGGGATATTTW